MALLDEVFLVGRQSWRACPLRVYWYVTETEENRSNLVLLSFQFVLSMCSMFLSQAIHPRFIGENLEKNKLIYSRVSNQAAKLTCTPPQLALAWLLHHGDNIIPIPGMLGIRIYTSELSSKQVEIRFSILFNLETVCFVYHHHGEMELLLVYF